MCLYCGTILILHSKIQILKKIYRVQIAQFVNIYLNYTKKVNYITFKTELHG